MQKKAKYSIIIPVHNSLKYLPTCIETIIRQDFHDYELIISDDNSTDGTTEYLRSLSHPNIKVIQPSTRLSMVEHFEWALGHSNGQWCMFLGGDDGLQAYFFELAERLTKIADQENIRVVMSERAYFFWEGCEPLYGKTAIQYRASRTIKVLNNRYQSFLALFGYQTYFELPHMYITSLFRCDLIKEAIGTMTGKLFSTIPPDSNLVAIAMTFEKRYVKSGLPLGWVGTSPGRLTPTSGLISESMSKSGISYKNKVGDFRIGASTLYLWNASMRVSALKNKNDQSFLFSKLFGYLVLAGAMSEVKESVELGKKLKLQLLEEAIHNNNINIKKVYILSVVISITRKFYIFKKRVFNYITKYLIPTYRYRAEWSSESGFDLLEESEKVYQKVKERNLLDI